MRHSRIRFSLSLEARCCMGGGECFLAIAERSLDNPEVLGHEGKTLALLCDDQRQGRRLHAAGRAHVAVPGELHQGKVARKNRAPDKVDVLAGSARRGKIGVQRDKVAERMGYLFLGEGGVARAGNRRGIVHFLYARKRIGADKLALAVEVGGDHDGIGLLSQVLQRSDDVLFLRALLYGRIHQIRQGLHLPGLQLHAVFGKGFLLLEGGFRQTCRDIGLHHFAIGGDAAPSAALLVHQRGSEVGFEDMASQADGHPIFPINREAVHGSGVHLVGLGLSGAEQVGDLLSRVVLLGNNQFHAVPPVLPNHHAAWPSFTRIPRFFV